MASGSHCSLLLSLIFSVLCSTVYSTPCNSYGQDHEYCNNSLITKIGRDNKIEDTAEAAAAHQANSTSGLHSPDTKVTSSTPKIWKSQTSLPYTTLLRHVHGVLNIIGWGTLMPSGIMIARYLREFPISCERWYSAHAVCQTAGYIMGIVGWGFGISAANSSERSSRLPFLALGITIIVLATIQLLAICVQPKKESGWRRRWEMYHHVMGYVIMGLIIGDIFEGINTQRHPEKWRWTYVGIVSFLALVAAALEIHKRIKLKLFKQAMKLNANMHSPTT
ncbi:cytochrome b561 and DOMON domain-containing protein At5g35735-like [Momordica charantia]|uniref:Cytochrome b561 and DOMON domain-containing protein At5g35735-like n=1 Tax=Momordica charantia TaxID=3673 RepID=A0A6J1BT20_MOMCH|nr:cytochrome b561 and DOMON domain-containing protein At5g35735-like [Momordica charantia]